MTAMVDPSQVQAGMAVWTPRGEKLGYVVDVNAEGFLVEKGVLVWRRGYAVPLAEVADIIEDEVYLHHGPDNLMSGPREVPPPSRRTSH